MKTVEAERQRQLPLRKAAAIAWRSIRVRLGRSLLVTAGIVLPIAFLMYILCSNAMLMHVEERGSAVLVRRLMAAGTLLERAGRDSVIQTRWMAGLALLISFVGILNAMLMSVTERFREIGTMKCLGALDNFIVRMFVLESVFQGTVGTVLGVLTGIALAYGEGFRMYGTETLTLLPAAYLIRYGLFTLVAGMLLTVGGAVYPAMRAAQMKPVDAMRSDL
jgi:putative ABC transport system permease protein